MLLSENFSYILTTSWKPT